MKPLNNDSTEAIQLEPMLDKTAISGKSVRFMCGLAGGSEVQFSWTKDGSLIVNSGKTEIHSSIDSSFLTIRSTTPTDSGNYTCIAKNVFSEDRATAILRVKGRFKVEMRLDILLLFFF